MGCIFSMHKKKRRTKDNLMKNLLLDSSNKYCFLCNKTFRNTKKYNKHIIDCNKKYRDTSPSFIY